MKIKKMKSPPGDRLYRCFSFTKGPFSDSMFVFLGVDILIGDVSYSMSFCCQFLDVSCKALPNGSLKL